MAHSLRNIIILALTIFGAQHSAAQEPPDPWRALPGNTAYELKVTFNTTLISSDALAWPDGRTALITYWRGGPAATYYRCVDYKDADFQSTGHSCWQLDSR